MSLLRHLLSRIAGSAARLSGADRLVLDAVRSQLHGDTASLWDRQVAAINRIQHLPGNVESNFYRMKHGRPCFDEALAFPNRKDELRLAKVSLQVPGVGATIKAEVWCIKGFLFSIEYSGDCDYFEEALGMVQSPQPIAECELLADLSLSTNGSTGAP